MTAPQGGFTTPQRDQHGQPLQQQAPQSWPPQQQPQAQPQPPAMPQGQGLDMNARLSGPTIPQELQGKTVGEALRYYQVMRQDFIQRNYQQQPAAPQGQPQAPQSQAQPQAPRNQWGQPQSAPQAQPQAPVQPDAIQQYVQQAVQQALAPVQQVSAMSVRNAVAQRFQDWAQYDLAVNESLQGAPPESLLNPAVWEAAYYYAKGRGLSQPAPQTPQQGQYQQQGQFQQPQHGAGSYPAQRDQYIPPPTASAYFVESPTPSAPQSQAGAQAMYDETMARKFGIPVEEYRLWKGGNVPPMQQQPNGNGGAPGLPTPFFPPPQVNYGR